MSDTRRPSVARARGAGDRPAKQAGDACEHSACEITMTELDARASAVIERVGEGQIAVVSKHGRPVAMIVPLADPRTLTPLPVTGDPALNALAERFERRQFKREWAALMHGRWYGPRAPRRY